MAKLTILSISVENLGPFKERQTLDLRVTGRRPVILVKALNGSGKTTLLTALQVGLYGHKAISGMKRTEYEQLMLGMQRKDAVGTSSVEVLVLVEIGGAPRTLTVRREWRRKGSDLIESLSIFEDGSKDLIFSDTWDEFIGSILPAELVQLFLFDGEKIEALANPERLPDLLRRATEVFLGIGGIEALGGDLKALERRSMLKNKDSSAEFESARANVASWEDQEQSLANELGNSIQAQASAKNVVEQAQRALSKYTAEAQRRGLAAYEQAASIRHTVVVSQKESEAARSALAEVLSDPVLPMVWLPSLWQRYIESWEADQHSRHSKLLAQEFKKRDQRLVAAMAQKLPKNATDAFRQALAEDLQQFSSKRPSNQPTLQDAPPKEAERQMEDGKKRLRQALDRLAATREDLDRAEQQIGQIPAEEQIATILKSLQERTKEATAAEAQLAAITTRIEELQTNLIHVRARLGGAQERLTTEFRDRSLEAKGLEASIRARKALLLFKDKLLASKAQWLSEMITNEFRNLLRKRNLVSKVLVDPVSYQVSIEDGKGQELSMDRLSAGERQLLAISVLSALIKERKGGRFPVVVDTPLARLDQEHRSSLIKRFFATVSHQVVVLSTDQEVDGIAYDTLKPYTNSEYSLDYDDGVGSTTINKTTAESFA
ncbi:DNA sulfur modification protein DndD [Variovorax fucosicus]|uniref:DNA sulfur modification protein DndD n=1 Tax=Variovorax fucosicus TaxID=3053517 RepID=UPI0025786C77|nr:DNA sulfur modification protein DndD [Variovorax sp. J22G47]MDM0054622.1 DNA sulfur modification protein DndD [Variovorax sp. J22G47]